QPILFVEIKSCTDVLVHHLAGMNKLAHDFGDCELVCFSRDTYAKELNGVMVYPWRDGIKRYFGVYMGSNLDN
ncbi:MAG TPA: hypothetical protein VJN02_11590, partial [Gammaproteobacteria bacterium]|nr:hypothetical protein [Gammaproteobacteria bacterium]